MISRCSRGWLTDRMPGDGLVILLGDHQPPAVVGGEPGRPGPCRSTCCRGIRSWSRRSSPRVMSPASFRPSRRRTREWRNFSRSFSPRSTGRAEFGVPAVTGRGAHRAWQQGGRDRAPLDSRWSPSLTRVTATSRLVRRSARRRLVCQGTASSRMPCSSRTGQKSGISARITRCRRPSSNRPSR